MELISITKQEADARLQKLSEERKAAKLTGPKVLEQLLAFGEELDIAIQHTERQVMMRRKRCLPNGEFVTEVVQGFTSDPAKDETRETNLPAYKPRRNAQRAARTKLHNVIHAARRIIFDRYRYSEQAWDQAVARGEVPADPQSYYYSLIENVPGLPAPTDESQWTIIAHI